MPNYMTLACVFDQAEHQSHFSPVYQNMQFESMGIRLGRERRVQRAFTPSVPKNSSLWDPPSHDPIYVLFHTSAWAAVPP